MWKVPVSVGNDELRHNPHCLSNDVISFNIIKEVLQLPSFIILFGFKKLHVVCSVNFSPKEVLPMPLKS